MLADIFHQALDDQQAHNEGDHTAYDQHSDLRARGRNAGHEEFYQLQGAGAQHGGDGQEEGELRAGAAAHAQQDRAQNGGAGAGGAGDQTQTLEAADEQGGAVVDVIDGLDLQLFRSFKNSVISVILGSVVYRIVIAVVLQLGMPPNDLKLFTSILVAFALAMPLIKSKFGSKKVVG